MDVMVRCCGILIGRLCLNINMYNNSYCRAAHSTIVSYKLAKMVVASQTDIPGSYYTIG